MQAVQDAADREVMMLEIEALKKRHHSGMKGKQAQFDMWVQEHQGETQRMIAEMVEAFEEEMSALRQRTMQAEKLLGDATRDIEFLMEENERLRARLEHK